MRVVHLPSTDRCRDGSVCVVDICIVCSDFLVLLGSANFDSTQHIFLVYKYICTPEYILDNYIFGQFFLDDQR